MSQQLSASAQKVQDALASMGYAYQVTESAHVTRTAAEAAAVVGCDVGQIAKSLIFRGISTGRPILVIASGSNRVNEQRIASYLDEPIGKADADFVREHTGFAIGGVPPVGHARQLTIFVDRDLLRYSEIWAAAGTSNSLFRLNPRDLEPMTGGQIVAIT